jgi:hypothetical protein
MGLQDEPGHAARVHIRPLWIKDHHGLGRVQQSAFNEPAAQAAPDLSEKAAGKLVGIGSRATYNTLKKLEVVGRVALARPRKHRGIHQGSR